MKKVLFLLVGLIFTIKGFSQSYHPIPLDNVWWVETYGGLEPQSGGPDCAFTIYKYIYPSGNSTNINGKQYFEFRYDAYKYYQPIFPPYLPCYPNGGSSNLFYALIHNDSTGRKVYIYDTLNTHQEYVVYDFNMNLGDTIIPPSFVYGGPGGFCSSETFKVSRIDSVDLGGEYRKRFGITKSSLIGDTTNIIEGVGNDLGFMFAVFCPFEDGSSLVCFHNNNLEYVPAIQIGNPYCTPYLSFEDEAFNAKNILIHIESNTFLVKNEEGASLKINCYDVSGKFILSQSFCQTGYLDLSEVSSGVYIMYLEYNNTILKPYKFIIQHS